MLNPTHHTFAMTAIANSYQAVRQAQMDALRNSLKALGEERLFAPAPPPALRLVSTPKKRKIASEDRPSITPETKARRTDGGAESTPGSGRRSSRVKEALERAESGEEMRRSAPFGSGLKVEEEDDGDEDGTPRRCKYSLTASYFPYDRILLTSRIIHSDWKNTQSKK